MLFLIILVLSFVCSFFMPWWAVAVAAFAAALFINKKPVHAFWSGFLAIFILWTVWALFKSIPNDNALAGRVIPLFPLPHSWLLLLLITAIIGGLVGGMGALSGALLKKAINK